MSVCVLLCLLVGRFARSYERSPVAWFFLAVLLYLLHYFFAAWLARSYTGSPILFLIVAVLFSPFVALIFLLVAGVPYAAVVRKEKEERARKQHPERADVREIALSELECPKCGAKVNPVTGAGLHSPEDEPWLCICNACQTEIEP